MVGTSQFAVSEELNKQEIPAYSPERMAKEFEVFEALRDQYAAAIKEQTTKRRKRLGPRDVHPTAKMSAMTQEPFRVNPSFPP